MTETLIFACTFPPIIGLIYFMGQLKQYSWLTNNADHEDYKITGWFLVFVATFAMMLPFFVKGAEWVLIVELVLLALMSLIGGIQSVLLYLDNKHKGSGWDNFLKAWNAAYYILVPFYIAMATHEQWHTLSWGKIAMFTCTAIFMRWIIYDGIRNQHLGNPFFSVGTSAIPDRWIKNWNHTTLAVLKLGLFIIAVLGYFFIQ